MATAAARPLLKLSASGQELGGDMLVAKSRTPEIMADAAHVILTKPSREFTGQHCMDDIVLYDAGVDVHKDDALGYLQLTDAGLAARDEAVLDHCLGRDIPVLGVIGGGYSKDLPALARRHGVLHHSAARMWAARGLG